MYNYGSIGIASIYLEPNKMITDNELGSVGSVSFKIHGVPLLVPSSLTYPNLWLHNELDINIHCLHNKAYGQTHKILVFITYTGN